MCVTRVTGVIPKVTEFARTRKHFGRESYEVRQIPESWHSSWDAVGIEFIGAFLLAARKPIAFDVGSIVGRWSGSDAQTGPDDNRIRLARCGFVLGFAGVVAWFNSTMESIPQFVARMRLRCSAPPL
jgi:hypothetical protein